MGTRPAFAATSQSASIGHLSDATRKRLTLVACILGTTIVFVDSTVVNVALPSMQHDLGGFRVAMAITAGLTAVGAAIGLAGIRNPGRAVLREAVG